ncbi:MAG: class E sortase [Anaerolineae bacterium]|nr:class E sortase [Anaerolineae bacterium]
MFNPFGCLVMLLMLLVWALVVVAWATLWQTPPAAAPAPTASARPMVVTVVPPTVAPPEQQILSIPALGLNRHIVLVPVEDGRWDIDDLGLNVGRLAGTAHIGDGGNTVIVGHITLPDHIDGPFIDLAALAPGSEVVVQTGDHRYTYTVEGSRVVAPDDLSVVAPTDRTTLTLMTCTGWDVPSQRYTERLVVTARLVETE